ncbi:hypothetical protein AAZV13_15G182700 [Glycine max]
MPSLFSLHIDSDLTHSSTPRVRIPPLLQPPGRCRTRRTTFALAAAKLLSWLSSPVSSPFCLILKFVWSLSNTEFYYSNRYRKYRHCFPRIHFRSKEDSLPSRDWYDISFPLFILFTQR